MGKMQQVQNVMLTFKHKFYFILFLNNLILLKHYSNILKSLELHHG